MQMDISMYILMYPTMQNVLEILIERKINDKDKIVSLFGF